MGKYKGEYARGSRSFKKVARSGVFCNSGPFRPRFTPGLKKKTAPQRCER